MDYHALADRIAADIAHGRLRPGDRLPPLRQFAHRQGIAASTASRVYAELGRRGLVAGEVGRGTFIRATPGAPSSLPEWIETGEVNLVTNIAMLPGQDALVRRALAALAAQPAPLDDQGARRLADPAWATALGRAGWQPDPAGLLLAGSARGAFAASFAALVPAGGRIGFESLSYPTARTLAQRLGALPVPLAMDEDGIRPDAIEAAHRAAPLDALYLQPVLHNPLGTTMPPARRAAVAALLRRLGLVAVEDAVYGFLEPDVPPLAALAPERVVLVDSLSKRVSPGQTLGFVAAPPALAGRIAPALRGGAWFATGLARDLAGRMLAEGSIAALEAEKRAEAVRRQALAREALAGLALRANPRAFHLWLELPEPWRAEAFAAAAARRGIAVSPGAAFAMAPGHAPAAVRLALGLPGPERLRAALATLAALARGTAELPEME
ncbi:PLP-dependent aminotransferase family protein [Roseomonas sp. NAR14]|uniref:PLP-dependent aminotransferase family protein n=1 Tax=Roseomonas acroporae TaxID=2937791 RepID=A0A9X2BTQ8_9PROT|nr:PLP-dependent aminotransferase family protein [Roseomonas acroporae]MCK8784873.1 PLP-dependent aminotransferase family protein [Roseomonas acroporae]